MKAALLLSGLPREWRLCLPTQLAMFREHELDVFFFFWDVVDQAEKDDILKLLKPKAYEFAPQRDFSSWDTNPDIKLDRINIPSRMVTQYYSWRQAARLFEPFMADYACAMRGRSDMQFVRSVAHILPQLKPGDLVLPWANKGLLISDMFALGDPRAIHYYHTMYDHVAAYAKTQEFNSEILLAHHLGQRTDFHYLTDMFDDFYFIRRPHMANYTIDQCLREKAGRSKWLTAEIVEAHRAFFQLRQGAEGEKHVEQFRDNQIKLLIEDVTATAMKKS